MAIIYAYVQKLTTKIALFIHINCIHFSVTTIHTEKITAHFYSIQNVKGIPFVSQTIFVQFIRNEIAIAAAAAAVIVFHV